MATFSYDVSTDRGKVRRLISDVDAATVANQVFDDDEIDAFLAMNVGVKRSAAAALMAIAGNALQVDKVLRSAGRQVDASKAAAEFRALAKALRDEADRDDDDDDGGLVIVDFDPWAGYRARWG